MATKKKPACEVCGNIARLIDRYGGERGMWGEHPDHWRSDWQHEVAEGDTVLGYWQWLEARLERAEDIEDCEDE